MKPFRSLKNGFAPDDRHGFDEYGKYAVYSLLTASLCGVAALFADDDIAEAPCPSEIGDFVLELNPAFHKVIASSGGTQIVIDTCADAHYDATGLGRFCHHGMPLPLGLAMPFSATPSYHLNENVIPARPCAIGPEWLEDGRWVRLAELQPSATTRIEDRIENDANMGIAFTIDYDNGVHESYRLTCGCLEYKATVNAEHMRLVVPILQTDGDAESNIHITDHKAVVTFRSTTLHYIFDDTAHITHDTTPIANRNGLYTTLIVENTANVTMRVD